MRVLITGATGYLGTAMLERIPDRVEVVAVGFTRGKRSLDVTDPGSVASAIAEYAPDVVVHLAAVSKVATAGSDPASAAAVNVVGAGSVAAATAEAGIRLVALSSDVVFDGTAAPYGEDALPSPLNDYGRSKLLGEAATIAEHPGALIIRTSVLVGRDRAKRYPFSQYVLERASAGLEIVLFENERRSFYPVTNAATAVWECVTADLTGFLHIGATTSASRFEFGRRLIEATGLDPDLATPTIGPSDRPSDLTLTVDRAARELRVPMPSMADVIAEVQRDIGMT